MPFYIVENDIVRMDTDAVVNAANTGLRPGSGVCGAIFRAAGYERLAAACQKIGGCEVGSAVITPGFSLPARYVIHTVGPIWRGGSHGEEQLLRSAYLSSMKLAAEHGCTSISFPLISAGVFGYPKDEALSIASEAIEDFLKQHEMTVYMVLYNGP